MIEIYFFDENEEPINTLIKFDCNNEDGTENRERIKHFTAELENVPNLD